MVSNCLSWKTHYLQGKWGGLGLLLPPNGLAGPFPHLPYALDNGAFPAWKNQNPWDEACFLKALDWCDTKPIPPRWVVVPDAVADADATFEMWRSWAPIVRSRGHPTAFAVQDGMTPETLEDQGINAEVIFVGGTRDWKMDSLALWCRAYPRVHVGRINGFNGLMACHRAGVESTDGTGFFRGNHTQLEGLALYLRRHSEGPDEHPMFLPQDDGTPRLPFA